MTLRLLIVDDFPDVLETYSGAIRDIVDALGAEVATESSSERAVERMRRERFDLVVSDFKMPGLDGIAVLAAARAAYPAGFRVLLTGQRELEIDDARIRAAGVDAYLAKPLPASEFRAMVADFLLARRDAILAHARRAREMERAA